MKIPELYTQGGLLEGAISALKLNGPGGLIDILNSLLNFLSGLFVRIPKLLTGLPLSMFSSSKMKHESTTSFIS